MDASGCMKSLLLAATQYRTAKTPPNAALLQRGLEVRAAPGRGSRAAAGAGRGGRACLCGRGVPSGLWARVAFFGSPPWATPARALEPPGSRAHCTAAGCRRPGLRARRGPRAPPELSAWRWGHSPAARLAGELVAVSVFSHISGLRLCTPL